MSDDALLEAHAPEAFHERVQALHHGEVALLKGGVAVKRIKTEDDRDSFRVGEPGYRGGSPDFYGDAHRTSEEAVKAAFRRSARSSDPDSIGGSDRLSWGVNHGGREVDVVDWTTDGKAIVRGGDGAHATVSPDSLSRRPRQLLASAVSEGLLLEADVPTRKCKADHKTMKAKGKKSCPLCHADFSKLAEAEVGKLGTNWKQVTPENRAKVDPLVRHWMKEAHPFTACVAHLTPKKGAEAAKKICAVVKDMGERSTSWRAGGKKEKVAENALVEEFSARLLEAADGDVEIVEAYLLADICESEIGGRSREMRAAVPAFDLFG